MLKVIKRYLDRGFVSLLITLVVAFSIYVGGISVMRYSYPHNMSGSYVGLAMFFLGLFILIVGGGIHISWFAKSRSNSVCSGKE